MKKTLICLVITFSGFFLSCNNSDNENNPSLTQNEILTKGRWNLKEFGYIINNELIADESYPCQDLNYIDFSVNGSFYETDFYQYEGNCIDSNIGDIGTWTLVNNILKRKIMWENETNFDEYEEIIRQLDLNNLIFYKAQTNEQGEPETYYYHFIR